MLHNKKTTVLTLLLSFILLFTSVFQINTANAATAKTRKFKTELGVVTLKGIPKRVVTLSMAGTDAVLTLGVKPVGYTISNSNSTPIYLKNKLKGVQSVGTLSAPSLERITALKPDLIIIDQDYEFHKQILPQLKKISPVVGFRANSYKESMNQLITLGDIMGKKAQAKAFVNGFNNDLRAAQAKVKDKNIDVLGLFVNKSGINVWQDNSFSGTIFTALKANYAYKARGGEYSDFQTVSLETILKDIDPDLIVAYVDPGKNDLKDLKKSPIWPKLKAVKNNHVVQVNRDLWSRSRGPLAAKLVVKEASSILSRYKN
jgi:iron complex transport system substrate-binding protein